MVPKLKHPASLARLPQCFHGTFEVVDDRVNIRVSKIAEVRLAGTMYVCVCMCVYGGGGVCRDVSDGARMH
jgi:hypothetical protein